MLTPRAIAKGKEKASSDAHEASETATAASEPVAGPSTQPVNSVEPVLELTEDERDRLDDIRFEVEVALSDWGLARFPHLVEARQNDAEGYLDISLLLECPPLKLLDSSAADIERCFADSPSELLELHADTKRIRRTAAVNESALAFSLQDWANMTLYVEGLPVTGRRRDTTPRSIRSFLSELFSVSVQTVRFPPHYNRDASSRDRSSSGDATLYESHPGWKGLDKPARRAQRMPEDGGSFDGFAFIVLADKDATEHVLKEWPFQRDENSPVADINGHAKEKTNGHAKETRSSDAEEEVKKPASQTPAPSAHEKARQSGLKAMTLADWNILRAAYLSYKRTLEKLEDEYEEKSWRDKERRRDRDRYDHNNRRRDDAFWSAKPRTRYDDEEGGEAKPRPSDNERWGHRSATPEDALAERIPGSLVSLRHVNTSGKAGAMKQALTALLARERPDKGTVAHVDLASGSIRATVRCSSAEAATALVEIFGGDPRTHSDAYGADADAFELMDPMDESPIVQAAVLSEAEEKAYWAELSRHDANDGDDRRAPSSSKKRGDRFDKPKSKHTHPESLRPARFVRPPLEMDHGVKRVRRTPTAAEKAKELEKISEYNAATAELVRRNEARDWSQAALDLTTRVIELNPEFTTAWNYRRRILRDGLLADKPGQEAQAVLNNDLHLTSLSLRKNPKNYSVWEHRKWLLRTMPDPDWGTELAMVEKQLDKDARNFHGWNYRRHVVNSLAAAGPAPEWSTVKRPQITIQSELAYTHAKISSNFSNFSAWHYRSKLFGKMSADDWKTRYEGELDLVRNALWTDPDDQSGWLYHSWLIGKGEDPAVLQKEIASLEELVEMEPDSKWCLETLVRYRTLLMRHHAEDSAIDSSKLRSACKDGCERLQQLDPPRTERYRWLATQIP